MKFYFTLQCKRIYRHIDEFGIIPIVGFAIIIALFIVVSQRIFQNLSNASYFYVGIGVAFSVTFLSTKRITFLKMTFPNRSFHYIRILENTLLALPFSSFLIYKQAYIEALLLHVLVIVTAFFKNFEVKNRTIPTPFGKKPFEFSIGFRKTFWVFPILYTFACIGLYVANYNLIVFSLIAAFVCCMSYYSKPEPLFYVWIYKKTTKAFLLDKIKTAFLFSTFLLFPIVILLFIFSVKKIDTTLIFLAIGYGFMVLAVLGKYANYPSSVPIFQAFTLVFSFMFPPLLILFIPLAYHRATKNLNSILSCYA